MTTDPMASRWLDRGLDKVFVDLRTPAPPRAVFGGDNPLIRVFMKTDCGEHRKDVVQPMVNAHVKTLKWIHTHSAEEITDKMPADYAGNRALDVTALKAQSDMYSPDGKMPPGGAEFVLCIEQKFNDSATGKHVDLSKTYDHTFAAKANR